MKKQLQMLTKRVTVVLFMLLFALTSFINEVNAKDNFVLSQDNKNTAIDEQRQLEIKYNVDRGNRPPIDLKAVPEDAYEKGIILLKLKPGFDKRLDQRVINASNKGFVETGISEFDNINQIIGAKKYIREIDNLYEVPVPGEVLKYKERHMAWGFHLLRYIEFDSKTSVIEVVEMFSKCSDVEYAEPIYKIIRIISDIEKKENVRVSSNINLESKTINLFESIKNDTEKTSKWTPNDPGYSNQYAFPLINAPAAWEVTKGNPNIIVAIVDGGIQYDHPDLAANMWPGIGPNGTGTIADYHGTHVGGTVAAVTNNGVGVAGCAGGDGTPNSGVKLMSCDIFRGSVGDLTAQVYAADNGAMISQNSWGYNNPGVYNQTALDGIDYFNANGGGSALAGGLVIFAAGNSNSGANWYPAYYGYDNPAKLGCMAVAATNSNDVRASFSNYGAWVDIAAPGVNILSTGDYSVGPPPMYTITYIPNSYTYMDGTSMACPHVSGVASAIVSIAEGFLSNEELWQILVNNTVNIDAQNPSFIGLLGSGRLNFQQSIEETEDVITGLGNPKNFAAAAFSTEQINLSWNKNDDNNDVIITFTLDGIFGHPVEGTNYNVGQTIPGGGQVIYKGALTSFNHTGLNTGTQYFYRAYSRTAANVYSSGRAASASTMTGWMHWDDNINSNAVGAGAATYSMASRWPVSDLTNFDGMQITKIKLYQNQVVASAAVKIWQGSNASSLIEMYSQPFTQQATSWIEVVLNEPYIIDGGQELWFGTEYVSTGTFYPQGIDAISDHPGKGNMVRIVGSLDWAALTDVSSIQGDWNIQAWPEVYIPEVYNPGAFTAQFENYTTINLDWLKNGNNDDVMIVYSVNGIFGKPADGTAYNAGQMIPGGGEVLYRGPNTSFIHTGLNIGQRYYYKAYSINNSNVYSNGRSASAATPSGWLHWDNGNYSNSIGTGGAATFQIASRWIPEDITEFYEVEAGMAITKIRFIPAVAATYTVKIWVGPNAQSEVLSQQATGITLGVWNEVVLNSPYFIPADHEMWFGLSITTTTGYPAGIDNGPATALKGDLIKFDGEPNWESLSLQYGINGNWNLQAWPDVLTCGIPDYYQDFTGLMNLPALWSRTTTAAYNWTVGNLATYGTGSNSVYINNTARPGGTAILVSECFDFTDYTDIQVSMLHRLYKSAQTNEGYVEYSDGGPWTAIGTFTASMGATATWTSPIITALAGKSNVQFRWRNFQNSPATGGAPTRTWAVDNISITATFIGSTITPGDVNDDGFVNVLDLVWLVSHLNGSTPAGFNMDNADVNGDTFVNIADLTALINLILAGAKGETDEVNSEPAYIYLEESGNIRFESDGTLLAIQFELKSPELNEMQIELLLDTDHKLAFNSEKGLGIIYSMTNSIIPGGEINLLKIQGVDLSQVSWGLVEASNVNHQIVEVYTYSAYDVTIIDQIASDDRKVSVFPNPNTGDFTVRINIRESAYLQIEFIDERGRMISKSNRKYLSKGEHKVQYNNQGIKSGLYVIRVNAFDSNGNQLGVVHEEKIMVVK
jgi:subtilisin family serine protease